MKEKTISQRFQLKLALIVVVALTASTLFVFVLNSRINMRNYEEIVRATLNDIKQDVEDTSDINMLDLTRRAKSKIEQIVREHAEEGADAVNAALKSIAQEEGLSEMSVAGTDGFIHYSNKDEYIDFDMNVNEYTREFNALNHGAKEVVQPVRQNAYRGEGSYDQYNKYAGVPLDDGGYVQVAINSKAFQKQIDAKIRYIAANRHIGQTGFTIVSNLHDEIVSDSSGRHEKFSDGKISELGLKFDREHDLGKTFVSYFYGEKQLWTPQFVEGYYIIGLVPMKEVQSFRDRAAVTNTITELIVFAIMFLFIYITIDAVIVSKIRNINRRLNMIIEGQLETTVDEYSTVEFAQLSRDINSTVSSLKESMAREKNQIALELEYAKTIQTSALPKLDSLPKNQKQFELAASMNTAKEVGGDFYDFYMLDERRLAVLVADVSGKGIPAAMFMMNCKAILKNLVESGLALDEAFDRANEELRDNNDAGMFVTAWMGVLDLTTGRLQYVDAGHNPPLFTDANGKFEYLDCEPDLILTGLPDVKYSIQERTLKRGAKFFLYTDGVTEAVALDGELYGEQRLRDYLNSVKDKSVDELLDGVKADLDKFVNGAKQSDDITMLAVCFR